jgi:DNA polymerase III delta prime subunit
MALNIHQSIIEKLEYFNKNHKIPNIIFHGQSGVGKRTIVNNFINMIYNNNSERIKNFVLHVNCAHGKGIKFIREELKFFAKIHIQSKGGDNFKSIILLNADKLTIDAQSALRRCIELFSHTTRFFILVEDKYKLLKPILSRFCEIYVPEPIYKGETTNLYKYNIIKTFNMETEANKRTEWVKKEMNKINVKKPTSLDELTSISIKLYEKGYSAMDIIHILESATHRQKIKTLEQMTPEKLCELLFTFHKVRKEFRSEKILILFVLNFLFLSLDFNLENISFM